MIFPVATVTGLTRASFLLYVSLTVVSLAGCDHGPEVIHISGAKMGTSYHITVVADQPAPEDLAEQIDDVLNKVDLSMSTYKSESELSQFNRLPVQQGVSVSDGLWDVLQISRRVWQQSDGAFDPSVGPIVDLWGFGPVVTDGRIPSQDEIDQALTNSGFEYLLISVENKLVGKKLPIRLDLSAVAKGYAVDKVADLLEMLALPDYLVEVGGEMRVNGVNPNGQPWQIAIETPNALGQVEQIIGLQHGAIATSGDYRNYFEKEGVRYSHTIDPRTGRPITHSLASVTVVTERCSDADAWATAFLVMGDKAALELANERSLAVYMIVRRNNQFEAVYSDAFAPYLTDSHTTQSRPAQ